MEELSNKENKIRTEFNPVGGVPEFIHMIRNGPSIEVPVKMSFTSGRDIGVGCRLSLNAPAKGRVVDLASDGFSWTAQNMVPETVHWLATDTPAMR